MTPYSTAGIRFSGIPGRRVWYKRFMLKLCGAAVLLAALAANPASAEEWRETFDEGLGDWLVPLPNDWKLIPNGDGKALSLETPMPIGTPRRPVKFAIYQPACVSDFELDVSLQRREKSLIVVFGYQDRLHFYYAHLSVDDGGHSVHNGLFKVYGGSRYRIGGFDSAPALPSEDWRRVRIVREVATGRIALFMDGEAEARFEAIDPGLKFGRIGLGSFDETGAFDDLRLSGTPSEACGAHVESPLDPS